MIVSSIRRNVLPLIKSATGDDNKSRLLSELKLSGKLVL